ncbi:uroporphyrinogen decarboxylase [Desulfosporosinus nitroreducens]|uniref:Uroporphyrinogen decarboxylase n=1 Tax=Desulfosporosinus nitroreducens TaxID=2018668 RepID=A0ABT8QTN6_9FIRM|nr:uroporphyrinogen decarboxylase [Desulfosporosinus nitroreducens]MCO1602334.1 uroporphyrinogen decarboxylase [Desulfosporosinus nitroreducens]MDO0824723.1 uroporphyrinogen decarboxylase [Desulfosporosinus nitroreducens]
MTDAAARTNERNQIFRDLFSGKTPKRVPISNPATQDFAIQHAGLDLAECQWDLTKLEPVYDKFCQDFYTDTYPGGSIRIPSHYQILGSTPIVMSSSGFMQHPDVVGMLAEEYDQFIASPYDCIVETILPRLYTGFNGEPGKVAMTLAKAMRAQSDDLAYLGAIRGKMNAKYGFATMIGALTEAPFDFMADFLRSFKGISGDVRRYPDKVAAACEAVLPLMIKKGTLPNPSMLGYTFIPLHMAPYLRDKDFATLYWPTFKKLVETLASMGQNVQLFVEQDWMRYLDYLYELPENTIMRFEYGDAKVIKEKLGKKHIISGLYPVTLLQTGTKQQCVDKAKELLDILAPGGRYWWQADKSIIHLEASGPVVENLKAVLDYVHENGTY